MSSQCIKFHSFRNIHVVVMVASYPDLPVFFNISRKMGRPGYEAKDTEPFHMLRICTCTLCMYVYMYVSVD